MAIAQCWLPDQELEVAGELGEVVLLLEGKNTPFPLGQGPPTMPPRAWPL